MYEETFKYTRIYTHTYTQFKGLRAHYPREQTHCETMQEAQLGEESTRQSSIRRQSSRKKNNSALHRGLRHVTNCLASPWTWTSGIFLLGIGDLACKWINLLALADERLQYGLLIGPVASNLWNIQLGFTIVATVLYLPEVINTMSAYCSGGETKVGILFI